MRAETPISQFSTVRLLRGRTANVIQVLLLRSDPLDRQRSQGLLGSPRAAEAQPFTRVVGEVAHGADEDSS